MLPQPLPVVGRQHHQAALAQPQRLELVEHEAHVVIRPAHLGEVEALGDLAAERLRRIERLVRVVVVEPEQEGLLRILAQEREAALGDVLGGARGKPRLGLLEG